MSRMASGLASELGGHAASGRDPHPHAQPPRASAAGAAVRGPEEIVVEMKGTLASKAVAHAEKAEEADLRAKHTLRGVMLRRYVTRHATWLFLGYCTIAAAEHALLETESPEPYARSPTSLFAVLFEILSAYGTNGLSFGYPGVQYNLAREPTHRAQSTHRFPARRGEAHACSADAELVFPLPAARHRPLRLASSSRCRSW